MRIRYLTEGPGSVWYDITEFDLPRDIELAKGRLVERCQEFFGAQFTRYDQILISLLRGSEVVVDIPVSPSPEGEALNERLDSRPAA